MSSGAPPWPEPLGQSAGATVSDDRCGVPATPSAGSSTRWTSRASTAGALAPRTASGPGFRSKHVVRLRGRQRQANAVTDELKGVQSRPVARPREGDRERPTRGWLRLRSSPLPAYVRSALHALLSCLIFSSTWLIEAERVELLAGAPQPVDVPRDDGSM
jgi:hypothetical protein